MSSDTHTSSGIRRLVNGKFPLRRITRLSKDIEDFQSFLRDTLPPTDWMRPSNSMLALTVLRCLTFRPPVENRIEAITEACIAILRKAGLETEADPIQQFLESIVGVGSLPSQERDILLGKGLDHLREVETLMERYEQEECVRKYRDDGQRGRDHQQNTLITFYQRCSRAHREITRFLTQFIDTIALENARIALYHNPLFGMLRSRAPYSYGEYWAEGLDIKKIDQCRHRMMKLSLREMLKLTEIYHAGDKARFYRILRRSNSPAGVFEQIEHTCNRIPDLRARAHIFAELRVLYNLRHWLAFTALALPQVEGLFADMLKLAGFDDPGKALPDKVSRVRKYYSFHVKTFDYFQFTLPALRNRFAHGGSIENPRETALDLLYDLGYLTGTFEHLKIPVMSLRKVIKNPEAHLSSLGSINTLIETVREIRRQRKFENVKDELEQFVSSYFTGARTLDMITQALADDVHKAIREFTVALKLVVPDIDLSSSSRQEFQRAWSIRKAEVLSATRVHQDLIDYFEDARYFAKYAPEALGPLPPSALLHLETLQTTHKKFWSNLERLKHLSANESSDLSEAP